MSELSILELEAQHGEVLPEREALSVGVAIASFNHHTTINHNTTTNTATTHTTSVSASNTSTSAVANSLLSSSHSSASQSVSVNG